MTSSLSSIEKATLAFNELTKGMDVSKMSTFETPLNSKNNMLMMIVTSGKYYVSLKAIGFTGCKFPLGMIFYENDGKTASSCITTDGIIPYSIINKFIEKCNDKDFDVYDLEINNRKEYMVGFEGEIPKIILMSDPDTGYAQLGRAIIPEMKDFIAEHKKPAELRKPVGWRPSESQKLSESIEPKKSSEPKKSNKKK